jgi:hypothetical protein
VCVCVCQDIRVPTEIQSEYLENASLGRYVPLHQPALFDYNEGVNIYKEKKQCFHVPTVVILIGSHSSFLFL